MALGHKSVWETQRAISSKEFAEWVAYYRLEPFGEKRADQRAGTIAAVIANVNRKKGKKAFSWKDFFPEPRSRQTPAQMLRVVEALNEAFGGVDLRQ